MNAGDITRKKDGLLALAEERFPGQHHLVLNGAKGEILANDWPISGWEPQLPPETNLYDHILLTQQKNLRQVLSHVQEKGQSQTCELAITQGGTTRWWSTRVEQLLPKHKTHHLLLLGTEITSHKMGETQDRISIPGQIANHFFHLLTQEGFLELTLDDGEQIYHASLLDYPLTEPGSTQRLAKHLLVPGAYLMEHRQLWLTPLQPSFGNIHLRRAQSIRVRIYEDVHSFDSQVSFSGIVRSQDQAAIVLSFPTEMRRNSVRGLRRVKIPFGLSLRVTLFPREGESFEGTVDDISPEGLAFFYPDRIEPIPVWEFVRIQLRTPEGTHIPMRAEVCSLQKTQDREELGVARQRCGLRFASPDYDAEKAIQKLVERIEKRMQQVLLQKRRKFETLLEDL